MLDFLRDGGYDVNFLNVGTNEDIKKALRENHWDVVINNYDVPEPGSLPVLKILKENGIDIPYILVSEFTPDENAIDMLRSGAGDFILKSNMARIIPALSREISKNLEKAEKRQEMVELREARDIFEAIFNNSSGVISLRDLEGRYILVNRQFERVCRVKREEIVGKTVYDIFPKEEANYYNSHDSEVIKTNSQRIFEETIILEDGAHTFFSVKFPVHDYTGEFTRSVQFRMTSRNAQWRRK